MGDRMSDEYKFWRDALAGKPVTITEAEPQPGYYKLRNKVGTWLPVAIWRKDGELVARVGNESRDPADVWTWCAKTPVSKDDAKAAFATGKWPGDAPDVGHNSEDVPLADLIRDYAERALAWLKKTGVKDTQSKDMAANYRAKLLELKKQADTERELEKRPHLEASRAVDTKFKPLVEEADSAANELRDALTRYMREEEARLEAERRAKWEQERAAVEAARREVEAQRAKHLTENPIAALTEPEPDLPLMPAEPEPVKVQAGGQRGRKTGLRTVTRYVVNDHAAALAFFANSEDVKELIQKLADRASKAGVTVPGVETVVEKVAA
jgi:hypothetical protein